MINVIGDIIIDEYWYGETTRVSPEAPVPIVDLSRKKISLGAAGNVYMNIRMLSDKVALHGYYDRAHGYIFDQLEATGNLMVTEQMPHKIRVFSGSHYMSRVDVEKTIEEDDVQDKFFVPNQFDVVVLSDYNKGTVKDPQAIIKKSKRTIVDPKVSLDKYKGAFILKPNLKEFEDYIGRKTSPKSLMSEAQRLRHVLDIDPKGCCMWGTLSSIIVQPLRKSMMLQEQGTRSLPRLHMGYIIICRFKMLLF